MFTLSFARRLAVVCVMSLFAFCSSSAFAQRGRNQVEEAKRGTISSVAYTLEAPDNRYSRNTNYGQRAAECAAAGAVTRILARNSKHRNEIAALACAGTDITRNIQAQREHRVSGLTVEFPDGTARIITFRRSLSTKGLEWMQEGQDVYVDRNGNVTPMRGYMSGDANQRVVFAPNRDGR